MNSFLVGTLVGIIAATVIVNVSVTARFQWAAWYHHAAVWTYKPNDWQPHFEWLDDYNMRTQTPQLKYYPPNTPEPRQL